MHGVPSLYAHVYVPRGKGCLENDQHVANVARPKFS